MSQWVIRLWRIVVGRVDEGLEIGEAEVLEVVVVRRSQWVDMLEAEEEGKLCQEVEFVVTCWFLDETNVAGMACVAADGRTGDWRMFVEFRWKARGYEEKVCFGSASIRP